MRRLVALGLLVLAACQPVNDHGHPHDESGGHSTGNGVPVIKETIWSDQLELYLEFPALVAGKISRFKSYVTVLKGYQPVKEGKLTIALVRDGKGIRHSVEISEEGIFLPALQPKEAGKYKLVVDLQTPEIQERMVLEEIEVYADLNAASSALAASEDESDIEFTKEQAWAVDFRTEEVNSGKVYDVIHTSGVWIEAPGTTTNISAKVGGIVDFGIDHLTEGTDLQAGQLILTIHSGELTARNLKNDIEVAHAAYEQSKSEYERNQELFKEEIVSKAELERVENRYRVAKTSYETLVAGYSSGGKQIKAPFSGFVKEVSVENGSFVEEGMELITMGNLNSRLLEIRVSPNYASKIHQIRNIWYRKENGEWSGMMETGGEVQSIARRVNQMDPMLSIFARINEQLDVPEGAFSEVQIAVGLEAENLVVAETALLEDYGAYSVMVQLGGERYERRPVVLGRRNGSYAEVLKGLEAGERVVTQSAYQVKMASLKGQTPAHGHTH